jgi:glutathionylspermidine synthase
VKKLKVNINSDEKIYLISLDYIYDIQNLNFIQNFLKCDSEIILINEIERFDNDLYYHNEKIKSIHKIYPWIWLIEDKEIDCFDNINYSEPLWTLLFDSKIILYILNKVFKNNILLETFIENQKKGCFVEKSLNGMQGNNNIKSNGLKKFSKSILQRRVAPIKINGDILNFSTWLVDRKFSGIGVKTDKKIISNHDHKFIPLAIE